MGRTRRFGTGLLASVAVALVASACGSSSGSTDDAGAAGRPTGGSGSYVIELYAGASANGPGRYPGGQVELSAAVAAQGLEDMETDYMAGYAERAGGTFDGKCFLVRHETETEHFQQKVLCGPVHLASGEVRWIGAPILVRSEGDEHVGFGHAVNLAVLQSESGPPTEEVAATLVRPDGAAPDLATDGVPSATAPPTTESSSPLSKNRWTEGPETDLGGDEIDGPVSGSGSGSGTDGHEGVWVVADLDVERLPDSTPTWGGLTVGGQLDATDGGGASTFAALDGECPDVDGERIVLGATADERWITLTRRVTCTPSRLPADVRRDDGQRLQVCWDDSRFGRGCVILDRA